MNCQIVKWLLDALLKVGCKDAGFLHSSSVRSSRPFQTGKAIIPTSSGLRQFSILSLGSCTKILTSISRDWITWIICSPMIHRRCWRWLAYPLIWAEIQCCTRSNRFNCHFFSSHCRNRRTWPVQNCHWRQIWQHPIRMIQNLHPSLSYYPISPYIPETSCGDVNATGAETMDPWLFALDGTHREPGHVIKQCPLRLSKKKQVKILDPEMESGLLLQGWQWLRSTDRNILLRSWFMFLSCF